MIDRERKKDRKPEIQMKFGQMHFQHFSPVQSSFRGGTRAHVVPASIAGSNVN